MQNLYKIIVSSLIILLASTVQGTVGFGFALIAVPLLTFLLPIHIIVPIIVVYSLITNIMIVASTRKYIRLRQIWVMIVCGVIGIPIGVYGLQHLSEELLKVIIGVLICLTTLFMAKGYKVTFKRVRVSYGVTGFISGILNGGLSMSGPPIVLFLSNEGYDKNEFRANLTIYATITNIITILVFALKCILTKDMIPIIGTNIIALLVGSYLGIMIASKIGDQYFRKLVLLLLTIVGAVTVIKVII